MRQTTGASPERGKSVPGLTKAAGEAPLCVFVLLSLRLMPAFLF